MHNVIDVKNRLKQTFVDCESVQMNAFNGTLQLATLATQDVSSFPRQAHNLPP